MRNNGSHNISYLFISFYFLECLFKCYLLYLFICLPFYLEPVGRLNQGFKNCLIINHDLLILEILNTLHLLFQRCDFLLKLHLLSFQQVRNLLLHIRLPLNNPASDLVKYLAYFTSILIGRFLKLAQVILNSEYLMLHLSLLGNCTPELHFKDVLLFGAGLLE